RRFSAMSNARSTGELGFQRHIVNNSNGCAILSNRGRYTTFEYNGRTITFLHGKDLIEYLGVKEWDDGYLVVECRGKLKGVFEDYIDLAHILESLYMDPKAFLYGIDEVRIAHA
ncbi:MAG: hypothetical protein Q4A07_12320, partial [Coriobacteriales bacterium]|nr:hypothetical protein [Coriobacteriales bacterium]